MDGSHWPLETSNRSHVPLASRCHHKPSRWIGSKRSPFRPAR